MNRIFVTGDTHGFINFNKLEKFAAIHKNLTKDDYIIICGDFGLLWNYKDQKNSIPYNNKDTCWTTNEIFLKNKIERFPFTTLFIDGNHENFSRLNSYPVEVWKEGRIHRISSSIIHLMRGEIYTIGNKKIFTFGGARSVDRGPARGTVEEDINKIWWEEELPSDHDIQNAKNNLNKHSNEVDYIITHTLPNNLLMKLGYNTFDNLTSFLWEVHDNTNFSEWYCGHYHIDEQVNYRTRILFDDVVEI